MPVDVVTAIKFANGPGDLDAEDDTAMCSADSSPTESLGDANGFAGNFGGPGPGGVGDDGGPSSTSGPDAPASSAPSSHADWRDVTPMTGSHIAGVDTGAKNGQTSFVSSDGQLQTIGSGQGSFGGGMDSSTTTPGEPHPIYRQLADQLAEHDAEDTASDGAASDGTGAAGDDMPSSSAEPLEGNPGIYVDYFDSPDSNVQGVATQVDVTLPAYADDPQAGADAQMLEDGTWYDYANKWQYYASTQPDGSVPLDTDSIEAAKNAYAAAAQAGVDGSSAADYAGKVADANAAINQMIEANGWSYGPAQSDAPVPLDTIEVRPDADTFASAPDGLDASDGRSTIPPDGERDGASSDGVNVGPAEADGAAIPGSAIPGLANDAAGASTGGANRPGDTSGDVEMPSALDRINGRIAGFNNLVKDDLVDEGAQAMRNGDRWGFAWNGIKYAFYQTFMPNSVQEGVIGAAGGPVIGKAAGWLGKFATHAWPGLGKGIGSLAGLLGVVTSRSGASQALARALEKAGFVRGVGEEAHHLVAWSARGADVARDILQKFDIDINAAGNGVFIPKAVNGNLNNPRYYDAVNKALGAAKSRQAVLNILDRIRQKILVTGTYP